MLVGLTLMLVLPAVTPVPAGARGAAAFDDPPIKVWLNRDADFARGERARVHVRAAEDGYVVVLRADAVGRVRVLFPLDPGDDNFVRGDKSYEIRGRGDREAFAVDDREGAGIVLAARSTDPFRFDEFVRGDHWDYRVLSAQGSDDDAEAALLEIVRRMAGAAHFDYDMETYTVGSPAYHRSYVRYYDPFYGPCFGCSSWYYARPYGFGVSLVFGSPYRYRRFYYYDPFFYDPFFHDPFFYNPVFYDPLCGYRSFCHGGRFGFVSHRHRPAYWGGFTFRRPGYGAGVVFGARRAQRAPGFVIPRDRAPIKAIEPRSRVPENRGLGRRGLVTEGRERSPALAPRSRPLGTDRARVSSGVRERRLAPAAPVPRERVTSRSRPVLGRGPAIARTGRPSSSVRSGRAYAPGSTRGGSRAAPRGERGTGRRQR